LPSPDHWKPKFQVQMLKHCTASAAWHQLGCYRNIVDRNTFWSQQVIFPFSIEQK
jgi:hypothetical protein